MHKPRRGGGLCTPHHLGVRGDNQWGPSRRVSHLHAPPYTQVSHRQHVSSAERREHIAIGLRSQKRGVCPQVKTQDDKLAIHILNKSSPSQYCACSWFCAVSSTCMPSMASLLTFPDGTWTACAPSMDRCHVGLSDETPARRLRGLRRADEVQATPVCVQRIHTCIANTVSVKMLTALLWQGRHVFIAREASRCARKYGPAAFEEAYAP